MVPFETYHHAGLTIELLYDDSAVNPRKMFDGVGTILSLTNEFDGDEYLSLLEDGLMINCPTCEGSGENQDRYELLRKRAYGWDVVGAGTFEALEPELLRAIGEQCYDAFGNGRVKLEPTDCLRCSGDGEVAGSLVQYVEQEYDAQNGVIIPLRYSDYGSSGSLIGEDDSDPNAVIFCDAQKVREEWDGDTDKARKCLLAEVKELQEWMCGEVYGYEITDADGGDLGHLSDSCWGFIGNVAYVREEAQRAAENIAIALQRESAEASEMAARGVVTV